MTTLVTLYHKDAGATEMTSVSASEALQHPSEWSMTSWPGQEAVDAGHGAGPTSREAAVAEGMATVGGGALTADGLARGLPGTVSPVLGPNYLAPVPRLDERTSFGDAATGMLPQDAERVQDAAGGLPTGVAAPAGDQGDEDEADETIGAYTVKHRGRGSWAVMKGDEVEADSLSKADAEAKARELNGSA